ncbi:MAG: superoxide dismutase [Raineya sp.]|jgi:Fe-Mn family superoxide dismutase|nr:superoxide dismutase [Raineya sp.]
MKRRDFIEKSAILASVLAIQPDFIWAKSQPFLAFELPPLPYDFAALEPHFDTQTMQIHHGKHHVAYVKNLNEAIVGTPFEKLSLEQILEKVSLKDAKIRNNAGGHYNHSLFWKTLSPQSEGKPSGKLAESINQQFGSFEKFKETFTEKAKSLFGSGWTWLSFNKKKGLFLENTPNQDNLLMKNFYKISATPILGLDIWEHAYYLKYQNKRADYIQAFWNVINWQEVSSQYEIALKKS